MEDLITRTRVGETYTRTPMESKIIPKTSREDRRPEIPVLKCHKCGITSHLANNLTKKTTKNEFQVIKGVQCTEGKEESDHDSAISDDTPARDYPIENIIQDAKMRKCYLQIILPQWKEHLLKIEGLQSSSASNNMYPLGILDTNLIFPHPTGIIRIKTEIVVMENFTSQHIILGNDFLNLYGIDTNNHEDINIIFPILPNKYTHQEEHLSNQLSEEQMSTTLSFKMRQELIYVLYTYKNSFSSYNEHLGAIRGHKADFTLNIDRKYSPVLRRPAYQESPRAKEALLKHIQELIQLGELRKVGHNEEFEGKTPVIIALHNGESRMVGDLRALNTNTVPDRYPIPIIQETFMQLSKANYISSMDSLKGFHQNFLMPKPRNYLELSHTVICMSILEFHLVLKMLHIVIKE
ncbi:hypothetical protein O181_047871 [Austropuccinia psidii MF-1]|uniref:Reverse transcriptase domain-containing protein n=1 Tax=Austropuccinia psidii MF-1 TaxID=1389203 RepID=A0A9Q3DPK8_9BASI|nr:hypothetical protein [Austropuccinia psidii MF-1]